MRLWKSDALGEPVQTITLDASPGVLLPFFDPDLSIVYVGARVRSGKEEGGTPSSSNDIEILRFFLSGLREFVTGAPGRSVPLGCGKAACRLTVPLL
jgi:hypothetical protein